MRKLSHKSIAVAAFITASLSIASVSISFAAAVALGNGFFDHGVAVPISNHRGTVATVDGQGRNVVLSWLYDHRGGYALLMIDAETGKSEQFPMPFPTGGDGPFSSILSSGNKFYTHFGSYFCEFDPAKRAFSFFQKTTPQMAMSMTEDDKGLIWSVTYPNSGVVSFNPKSREFKDFGSTHKENWAQYPYSIALDDAGWLYFGIGSTASLIVAFDPVTGKAKAMLPESERGKGHASVYRDMDGKVYGQAIENIEDGWYEFYRGVGRKIGKHTKRSPKAFIAVPKGSFHRVFPDGKILKSCDLETRFLTIVNPETKETQKIRFNYESDGASILAVTTSPDGNIIGATAIPMFFFNYNPRNDEWIRRASYNQWNTLGWQGDRLYIGGYTEGFLLEWNPKHEWVATDKGNRDSNPLYLTKSDPTIDRPNKLLAHPGGRWIVLAGTPAYGYTGGGLLFWDIKSSKGALIKDIDIITEQSTFSLVAIQKNKLLGGTTTSPGTGGEKKAKEAELYIMDIETKKIDWHQAVFSGAQTYTDMCLGGNGLIYGIVDYKRFFVFDPVRRKVIYDVDLVAKYGSLSAGQQQGPRVFVTAPNGTIYVLLRKGTARLDQNTHEIKILAESPVPIVIGGDYLDGRIYFGNGAHVYSFKIN